jgi:spectinomycin phosphotransferase
MLTPPNDLDLAALEALLASEYGLGLRELRFLPLGADLNTAVYRLEDRAGGLFFLKMRRGDLAQTSIQLPYLLAQAGLAHVIAPIANREGALATPLGHFHAILSPFIEGHDAWNYRLSPEQWQDFGRSLRFLHTIELPAALWQALPRERYDPIWRNILRHYLHALPERKTNDEAAHAYAELLRERRTILSDLLERSEQLAAWAKQQSFALRPCHADIHAGNLLIDSAEKLYLVDWDTLLAAPVERDLMFIGAGIGAIWNTPNESAQFFAGYGELTLVPELMRYYRFERIVEDFAVTCQALFESDEGGEDRPLMVEQLEEQFGSGSVIEMAYAT